MQWKSPVDAMPWVGLYVSIASLVCTLAMAIDVFLGFRQRKLWFPCRFFTINAASITLIAITMKIPVDLSSVSNDQEINAKFVSLYFLVIMVANFLPSLGLMNDKELLLNIIALCILMLTIIVNMLIQGISAGSVVFGMDAAIFFLILLILLPFSVALSVSMSRKFIQKRYKELQALASNHQEMKFSSKGHIRYLKKYWMMTETGNPQFAIACSPVSFAFGVICSYYACGSLSILISQFLDISKFGNDASDYKWSISAIIILQLVGVIVGSIAPIFRCLTAISHFSLSRKWSRHHLNVFRVEKHWLRRLQLWKSSPVPSIISGRHCKKVFHKTRNMILNLCVALQIMIIVICNMISVIPRSFLILVSYCYYFVKSSWKRFKGEPRAANSNITSDMKEYSCYVLQVEPDAKLSKRILRNALKSITRLLHESEKKETRDLMKLLDRSTGFNGVVDFDNEKVLPLGPEELQNCWSLVAVTLTAIAVSLPKISDGHINSLLAGVNKDLQFVRHIEESLNANDDLVKARKAARRVWTDVEVYGRWLHTDLQKQKKACTGTTTREIIQWLGDEAVKTVIRFKKSKNVSLDQSLHKFIAATSMYRISQTILLHCNEQENWPPDEELFELISTVTADVLCACFTNLPRVITMKCHEDAIEKREDSIRIAAQLLGRSKKILKMLKARQLPNLDMDSMPYLDKWHALPKDAHGSARSRPVSSSSNESFVVTIT